MTNVKSQQVTAADQHAVPLYRHGHVGEAFMLCDDCGVLSDLPTNLTLN